MHARHRPDGRGCPAAERQSPATRRIAGDASRKRTTPSVKSVAVERCKASAEAVERCKRLAEAVRRLAVDYPSRGVAATRPRTIHVPAAPAPRPVRGPSRSQPRRPAQVRHQVEAVRANVWSWFLIAVGARRPRLMLEAPGAAPRCIAVLSPGGPERLERAGRVKSKPVGPGVATAFETTTLVC